MPVNYSLHKIESETDFCFSPKEYSRFKFGDFSVAESFGYLLAKGFIKDYLAVQPISQQIVVVSSPYSFIPTATFAMKTHFVFALNQWLVDNNFPVVQEAKVHRVATYKEDYGALTAEQRIQLISNDTFHIDKDFIEGKVLIFLDDIKITGSHEKMILKMVQQYKLENEIFLLYFAELVNKSIHPNIENYLNYACVESLFDLHNIINSGHFAINTRVVKYLLNSDTTSFRLFMQDQTPDFALSLYNMAIGNSYHTMDSYADNLKYIKEQFINNKTRLISYGN